MQNTSNDEGKDNGKGNTNNGEVNGSQPSNMNKVMGNGKGNMNKVEGKHENYWPARTQSEYDKEDAALAASEAAPLTTASAIIDLTSPQLSPLAISCSRLQPVCRLVPNLQFYEEEGSQEECSQLQ